MDVDFSVSTHAPHCLRGELWLDSKEEAYVTKVLEGEDVKLVDNDAVFLQEPELLNGDHDELEETAMPLLTETPPRGGKSSKARKSNTAMKKSIRRTSRMNSSQKLGKAVKKTKEQLELEELAGVDPTPLAGALENNPHHYYGEAKLNKSELVWLRSRLAEQQEPSSLDSDPYSALTFSIQPVSKNERPRPKPKQSIAPVARQRRATAAKSVASDTLNYLGGNAVVPTPSENTVIAARSSTAGKKSMKRSAAGSRRRTAGEALPMTPAMPSTKRRRTAVALPEADLPGRMTEVERCVARKMILNLRRDSRDLIEPYLKPVDPVRVPLWSTAFKRPSLCIDVIQAKVDANEYEDFAAFEEELAAVFVQSSLFNPTGGSYFTRAAMLMGRVLKSGETTSGQGSADHPRDVVGKVLGQEVAHLNAFMAEVDRETKERLRTVEQKLKSRPSGTWAGRRTSTRQRKGEESLAAVAEAPIAEEPMDYGDIHQELDAEADGFMDFPEADWAGADDTW